VVRNDTLPLVEAGSLTGKFKNLGREILENSG
jgi:hypothetical protein